MTLPAIWPTIRIFKLCAKNTVCNFLLSWHIASVRKTFQSGGKKTEHMKMLLGQKLFLPRFLFSGPQKMLSGF